MFDTIHLEVPRGVDYARNFLPICRDLDRLKDEGMGKGWRVGGSSSPFRLTADLRDYDIPILLHTQPRWSNKTGDKVELVGAGDMRTSDMVEAVRQVYRFNVGEAPLMRVDCTADVKDVPVDWFARHTRVKFKAKGRGHGRWSEQNTRVWETIYSGDKPNQLRVYDKTGERMHQLKKMKASLPKSERENVTFESMFGFAPSPLTRVERQMGARSTAKVFGIQYFDQLGDLARKPVFKNIIFPETARQPMKDLVGMEWMAAMYLKGVADDLGIRAAMNEMKRRVGCQRTFERRWPRIEGFLHAVAEEEQCKGITLAALTDRYHTSCLVQMAA